MSPPFLEKIREFHAQQEDDRQRFLEDLRRTLEEDLNKCPIPHLNPDWRLTNQVVIDGKLVYVIDNALHPKIIHVIFDILETRTSYQRTEYARPDTVKHKHFVANHELDEFQDFVLFEVINELVQRLMHPDYQVNRAYTNLLLPSDVSFVHSDCAPNAQDVTALYYPNPEWTSNYGGETQFYSDKVDLKLSIQPIPGRILIFDGGITHVGRPPSRLSYVPRYTMAMKFSRQPRALHCREASDGIPEANG